MRECVYSFKHSKPPHRAPRSRMGGALTPPPPTPLPCRHMGICFFFYRFSPLDTPDTMGVGPTAGVDVMPNTKTSVPLGKRKLVIHRPVQSPRRQHSPNSAQEPANLSTRDLCLCLSAHKFTVTLRKPNQQLVPAVGLTLYGNTATRPAVTMVTK